MNFMNFAHHREYILSHITYQCQLLNGMTLNLNALGKSKDEEKPANVNCEQPLFFFQSRAWSFACLGRFAPLTKKKERLLVVYRERSFRFVRHFVCLSDRSFSSPDPSRT